MGSRMLWLLLKQPPLMNPVAFWEENLCSLLHVRRSTFMFAPREELVGSESAAVYGVLWEDV